MSKKINKIKTLINEALSINSLYLKDYLLLHKFLDNRDFDSLLLLIKSIITKEERKPKPMRLENFHLLIEAKVLIEDYLDKLQYNPETNGQFEDY